MSMDQSLLHQISNQVQTQTQKFANSIKTIIQPYIHKLQPLTDSIQPYIQKGQAFYADHKELVLIVSVASLTYLLVRTSTKEDKHTKKKSTIKQSAPKSFMSDNEQGDYLQEPSTATRKSADSSGRQIQKGKHRCPNSKKMLQRIDSSSAEEGEDKIFFEMYKTYQFS